MMTPYEIWKGRKPNVEYFHIFESTCYILNDYEYIGKLDFKSDDFKSDEGMFLGYYKRKKAVMESINVVVDDA